jgi:hypothetical protein
MIRSRTAIALSSAVVIASMALLHADVKTDEKTTFQIAGALGKVVSMFGGKGAREGIVSTMAVKGTRKLTMNDSTGQIVDLSEEKVYDLDIKRKTYRVTTFADMRKRMEEERQKAEADAKKEQPAAPAAAPASDPNANNVEVDFDIKSTGATKTINGFDTKESVVTVTVREKGKTLEQGGGMVMTTDMWLAPTVPALKELAEFDLKYYQQLYGPMIAGASPQDMATAMAMYPMVKPAMAKMNAEGGKITGTPILTTMKFDAVKSADELAQEQQQAQSAPPAKSSGGLSGRLAGALASKAMKKDDTPQARATFITTTNEVLKVATDVGANDVAIPAGFKESK